MAQDWYPSREAERRLFLQNFVDNMADATTLLKQPANTYGVATTAAQAELDLFGLRDAAQKALDTAQRNLIEQELMTSAAVRAGVKQIKNTMNVPREVLDLLEVNPTASKPIDRVAAEAPVLKAKMDGIHPSIGGLKNGFDAIEIWCCRTGEKDFSRLATVTHLPYFDNRPNGQPAVAEQRDYYAYYLRKNVVASAQGATYTLLVPAGDHA
ncbi:hypothetical protein [Hymenobacter terricola]|uniref:hypothetical protein n=1 Tax=Hymenobacter terricola TaxID=2819236 RepID=UPI001B317892|nr:hypothetical protein [Hymenobacter terricola]